MQKIISYDAYAAIRDKKGISDYAVAKQLGISRSVLSEWKSGLYTPKIDKLVKIAEYFNVPIEYFLNKEEE